MSRIDRSKRALGTAVKRTKPSRAAELLIDSGLIVGRVLDYGCGFGFDADKTEDYVSRRDKAKGS